MNEIKKLRTELSKLKELYQGSGMIEIKNKENVLGFFPYADGIWMDGKERPKFPKDGIMILGQDFGTSIYIDEINDKGGGESDSNATWRNLKFILKKSGIHLSQCFFTNAIMGAREGGMMTGPSPVFKRKNINGDKFIEASFDFFKKQVKEQEPKLIICLGKNVYRFLKINNLDVRLSEFQHSDKYKELPEDIYSFKGVKIGEHITDIVLIVHPSTPNRKNTIGVAIDIRHIKNALN